jgi:DNA (cytosine-5)-methyltransferase 1
MEKPVLFSFFSGLGILDLGFEKEGFSIAYANEKHKPFLDAYKHARKKLRIEDPLYGHSEDDATCFLEGKKRTQLGNLLKDCRRNGTLIGFIAGPPCPDFSIGGKNRGHRGDHGRLSETYVELISQYKPDFFLFENVKGLWKTRVHRAFYEKLKQKLSADNYCLTDRLINAIEYGTPQDRDRIVLLGFSKGLIEDLGLLWKEQSTFNDFFPWKKGLKYPDRKAFEYPWPATDAFEQESDIPCPKGIPLELTVEHWFRKNDVYGHPDAEKCFKPRAGIARFLTVDEGDERKKSFKRLHRWRYSPTACYGNNEVHLHPYKPRRISVAESLAIQSLPKKFALPPDISLTNSFKAVGNGVPYLAAKGLAKSVSCFIGAC